MPSGCLSSSSWYFPAHRGGNGCFWDCIWKPHLTVMWNWSVLTWPRTQCRENTWSSGSLQDHPWPQLLDCPGREGNLPAAYLPQNHRVNDVELAQVATGHSWPAVELCWARAEPRPDLHTQMIFPPMETRSVTAFAVLMGSQTVPRFMGAFRNHQGTQQKLGLLAGCSALSAKLVVSIWLQDSRTGINVWAG